MTERALHGRGAPELGEWREVGRGVFHIRRRLSADECALAGGLVARDIRRTAEGAQRIAALPPRLRELAASIGEAP